MKLDATEIAMSSFMISDKEFQDAMNCADAIQQFAATFPDQWTSIALSPTNQQLFAELIRAGAISLRKQQQSS